MAVIRPAGIGGRAPVHLRCWGGYFLMMMKGARGAS